MRKIITIWMLACMTGCLESPEFLSVTKDIYVVEGWISNMDTVQTLKISKLISFGDTQDFVPVPNGLPVVYSDQNEAFTYTYMGNGIYQSEVNFSAIAGRYYHVEIQLPGIFLESIPEYMNVIPEFILLNFNEFQRKDEENPREEITIYYPVVYAQDEPNEENFYRWKMYRNDTLFSEADELFLLNDRFINGNNFKQEFTAFEYDLNDKITVEMMSINSLAYRFLAQLKSQTTLLGTNAAIAPAPLTSNIITNDPQQAALGYFGTNAIMTKTITVQ